MKSLILLSFISTLFNSPESRLSFTYNFTGGPLQDYISGGGGLKVSTFFCVSPWLKYGISIHLSKYSGAGESPYFFILKGLGLHIMTNLIHRFWSGFSLEGGIDWSHLYRELDEGSESEMVIILSLNPNIYLTKDRVSLYLEFPFQWIPGNDKSIFLYGLGFGVSFEWGLEPGLK